MRTPAPKVLHILDHSVPIQSGYAYRTLEILRHLRELGIRTEQITSLKHYKAERLIEVVGNVRYFRTLPPVSLAASLPVLGQIEVIRTLMTRMRPLIAWLRPDILHAHSPCLNGLAAIYAARDFGIPVVYEMRALWEDAAVDHGTTRRGNLRYRLSRSLETHVLKRADAITTISEGLHRDIVSRGIPENRITVVPNAVNADKFQTESRVGHKPVGLNFPENTKVVGFIGSFYNYEGLDLLLSAVPGIIARKLNTRFVLVGGGFEMQSLKCQADRLGISDRVQFTGRVPHDEVERYYELFDVCVYPRIAIRLTELVTPLKPLEAMAMGKIVVASDVGGHREMIDDGTTGYLFKAGCSQSLASKVLEALEERREHDEIRAAAREYIEQKRNWSSVAKKYSKLYGQLLAPAKGLVAT